MKRTATRCLYDGLMICLILAGLSGLVRAQDEGSGSARVSDQPSAATVAPSPIFAEPAGPPQGFFPMTPVERWFAPRFYVDSRAGTLYGYEESFSSLGGFVPYFFEENAMLFADGRGLVGYDGRGGANAGVGWRYYMPQYDRYVGLNTYYDFDASHARSYNQIGLGFESIGRYFDLILNGYVPIGNDTNLLSTALIGQGQFAGNQLLLDRFNEIESAFTGFDANIGGPMPIFGRYGLQGYVGFYFFTSSASKTDFTGVSGRLAWQINEDWNIGVNMTDDHVFGTNTQMQITMTLPDGKPSRWLRPLSVRDRMMQSPQRNYRVTAEREIKVVQEAAINPKDGQPYFIVHVNPNVAGDGVAAGDGTVENPYNLLSQFDNLALADKTPVDIIYVQPRTDNTSTNLNEGVTLLSCQRLLSNSMPHFFEVAQNPGVQYQLSGFVPGQELPVLTNDAGGDVVTFADGAFMVEVSGFEINGNATGSGIAGTNNSAVSINRNVIQNGLNGIALTNLTGLQADDRGSFIVNNIIRNNAEDGINVSNSGVAPLDLVIANNAPRNLDFDGVLDTDTDADGVNDASAPDSLDGDGNFANDGILSNGDDGIDVNMDAGSVVNLAIDSNQIRGNQDNGIELDATAASTINGAITDNILTGNQNNAIFISADNSTLDFLNLFPNGLQGEITGNEIRDNVDDGIEIVANNSQSSFNIYTNRFGVSSFDLTDPLLIVGPNLGWGVNLSADGGETLMVIGGPTAADGNIFLDPGLGAVQYNLSGDNLTTSNIQFNQVISAVAAGGGGALIRTGFNQNTLAGNDDGSTGAVPIGFNANFFGVLFNQVFVNNNGNVTLNQPLGAFTPFPIVSNGIPMLAPFFADVDTRAHGDEVTYGTGTVNGQNAFGVNWDNVDYFVSNPAHGSQLNSFQLVLIDRSDIAPGDFDIEFNYDEILWETGDASGGTNGLGGSSARAGYTNGVNNSFEFAGSGVNGALLDGGPAATSLTQNSLNSPIDGRYVFNARNGVVVDPNNGGGNQPPSDTGAIRINVTDTAQLVNSFVQDNTVVGQTNENLNQFALNVASSGLAQITNLTVQDNTFNQNDGGMRFSRAGSSRFEVFVDNNTVDANRGNGWEMSALGTPIGGLFVNSQDNVISDNEGDGANVFASENAILTWNSNRDQFLNNAGDNISALINGDADVTIDFDNVTSTDATGNGFNANVGGTANFVVNVDSPVDPLFLGTQSSFSNNELNGFRLLTEQNALALVNIQDTLFSANGQDGINLNREDASLLLAQLTNSLVTTNEDDGVQFYTTGADRDDPNTPLFNAMTLLAPASSLTILNTDIDANGTTGAENGGNGIETATFGDSVLDLDVTLSSISDNATDGVRSFVGVASSFGEATDRVTFDAVDISGNGRDGIKVFVQGNLTSEPTAFVEVNSNTGNTTFLDNGDDGVQGSVPFGTLDILIQGDTVGPANFTTLLADNAGNGIEFNVADAAFDGDDTGDLSAAELDKADLTDLQWAENDADADGVENEIANFFFPNGYNITPNQTSLATLDSISGLGNLTVRNVTVGDPNLNDANDRGNQGDGIQIFSSENVNYSDRFIGGSGVGANFVQTVTGGSDTNVVIDNTVIAGNDTNGLRVIGDGFDDRDGFAFSEFAPPNIIRVTATNNTIAANDDDGVDINLNGNHGFTQRFGVLERVGANSFIFDNNVIERNGANGVFYQSNAGFTSRLGNNGSSNSHIRMEFQDPQPTNPPFPYDPDNVGAVGQPWFQSGYATTDAFVDFYLNLATTLNSQLVFTNNRVQFNGALIPTNGDGMSIRVGTNTYLSADIGGAAGSGNGNVFSGNALADVRFESFIAYDPNSENDGTPLTLTTTQPGVSVPGGAPTPDVIFLDDTAQMDLRFNNNIGSEVSAPFNFFPDEAAVYSVSDIVGGKGAGPRPVQVFQVDDGFNLDATNTWASQILPTVFGNGNFYRRTVADPAFPNLAFPVNYNTNPGNPFLP